MAQCMFNGKVKAGQEVEVRGVLIRFDKISAQLFSNFINRWKTSGVMPADTTTISVPRADGRGRVDEERGRIYRALL